MNMTQQMKQQMNLAPALQKSLQLLQMNVLEFTQEINDTLERNPLLEREDDQGDPLSRLIGVDADGNLSASSGIGPDADDASPAGNASKLDGGETRADDTYVSDFANFEGSGARRSGGDDGFSALDLVASQRSLRSHLLEQIGAMRLAPVDQACAAVVVESLDDNGYLYDSIDELLGIASAIVAGLGSQGLDITRDDLVRAISRVRQLDPIGVGAASVADCLGLQLAAMAAQADGMALATDIVSRHLEILGNGDFRTLATLTGASQDELVVAVRLIRSLTPKPGANWSTDRVAHVVPEVIVRKVGKVWQARLHPAATPKVRVNTAYADIVSRSRDCSEAMSEQLAQARWLLRTIDQRASTIEKTAMAIVARQQAFFTHGDIGLQPMRLADVAADIGVHESTVSRVVNSKYLQCARGLISFKRFFTSHVETRAGDACSATAVKAMIQQLVEKESPTAPMSDHRLARMLADRGIRIARRTVTKYRDALGIEAFEMRRCAQRGAAPAYVPDRTNVARKPSARSAGATQARAMMR